MEFLKGLFTEPLSFEAFEKAVNEKGIKLADISKGEYVARNKFDKANDDLKEAKETIETLTSEAEKLKNDGADAKGWKDKFETLQNDIKQKEEDDKKAKADAELTEAITAVFGDKKFTSDYVRNGIIADMKAEIGKAENKGKGYAEIFESLTKDKEGLFVNPNTPADMKRMGDDVGTNTSENTMREIMGLAPKNN